MYVGDILLIGIVIIFIFMPITVMSVMMLSGHGNFFIARYISMIPDEEKEKYDKKALLRFIGKVMLIIETVLGMIIGGAIGNILWLMIVGMTLFIAVIVATLLYFNAKDRFKRKK